MDKWTIFILTQFEINNTYTVVILGWHKDLYL